VRPRRPNGSSVRSAPPPVRAPAPSCDIDLTDTARTTRSSLEWRTCERLRPAAAIGRGWDQNKWGDTAFRHTKRFPPVTPNNPVVLTRIDGTPPANARR
jgi:hypothetical protein